MYGLTLQSCHYPMLLINYSLIRRTGSPVEYSLRAQKMDIRVGYLSVSALFIDSIIINIVDSNDLDLCQDCIRRVDKCRK